MEKKLLSRSNEILGSVNILFKMAELGGSKKKTNQQILKRLGIGW